MNTITKVCKSIKDAERFQNSLYSKYETVKLIQFPVTNENGTYVWYVTSVRKGARGSGSFRGGNGYVRQSHVCGCTE